MALGRNAAGLIFCAAAGAIGLPAAAHHSAAMFDRGQEVVFEGTVREFQYTNPHSWLQLVVTDENGNSVEWSFEAAAPNALLRRGIRPVSLTPGETVTARGNPMADGSAGALLIDVTKADGTVLSFSGG
jgi:hypothetical protein